MSDQFLRQCSLTVASGGSALDLSEFRIVFRTRQSDTMTPNSAVIRVYNLADKTTQQIQKEFTRVVLQVGYKGASLGTLFDGTIKQFGRGRESATDTYLDLMAADADAGITFGFINQSHAAGVSAEDQIKANADAMGIKVGYMDGLAGGTLPRGKVSYGMAKDHLRDLAKSTDTNISVQDNEIIVYGKKKVVPGTAIVLNSKTGLIGVPEQTDEGIRVRCLINPEIKIGGMIQINNASINQVSQQPSLVPFDQFSGQQLLARVADDGFYRVWVSEHEGDTRGNNWYSNLVCLSVDQSGGNTVPAG